jgi:hypothetical protein
VFIKTFKYFEIIFRIAFHKNNFFENLRKNNGRNLNGGYDHLKYYRKIP